MQKMSPCKLLCQKTTFFFFGDRVLTCFIGGVCMWMIVVRLLQDDCYKWCTLLVASVIR